MKRAETISASDCLHQMAKGATIGVINGAYWVYKGDQPQQKLSFQQFGQLLKRKLIEPDMQGSWHISALGKARLQKAQVDVLRARRWE
jgi:hypothetical protein